MITLLVCLSAFIIEIANCDNGRIECYFCEHTESRVALPEQRDLNCFRNFSYEANIKLCALGDVCKVDLSFVNDATYEINRDCEDKCHPLCITDGYGITTKTCTFCCNTSRCNNRTDSDFFNASYCIFNGYFVLYVMMLLFREFTVVT